MKPLPHAEAFAALLLATFLPSASAQLTIPSDGSDGALIVTNDTVIDLSKAVTGAWNAANSANAGKGIYDSNKWAVVFKYSSVSIAEGATVTFANHASRAPVVWLVRSNVTVAGTLSLDGQRDVDAPGLAEPGPGGFRGGQGNFGAGLGAGAGFGPGGGIPGSWGYSGGYGAKEQYSGEAYGNPSLLPLIGGSGGGGYVGDGRGGGAGEEPSSLPVQVSS
jgi:plastocyanin